MKLLPHEGAGIKTAAASSLDRIPTLVALVSYDGLDTRPLVGWEDHPPQARRPRPRGGVMIGLDAHPLVAG